jgi:phosphatidylglycerophosphatase A
MVVLGGALVALIIGIIACAEHVRVTGNTDPSECVIDELAGQWLACAFAPRSLWAFVLAFLLFRLFDITKPWPIRAAERIPGGLGVMLDDMIAGLAAGLLVLLAAHMGWV